ncbi:hypothetical protein QL285_066117 [Trifolium repens]|nr:hypothetical protein QL285_066117 [Trifolium repens]
MEEPSLPRPFYWCGYWGVKSTSNVVCNQETKPVAAREALLTILAEVKEEELHVLRFVRELILVLYLYRFLNIMRHQRRNLFNQGDQVARREALLARERETLAKLCMEFRGSVLASGDQFWHQVVSASFRSQLQGIEPWSFLLSSTLITTEPTND